VRRRRVARYQIDSVEEELIVAGERKAVSRGIELTGQTAWDPFHYGSFAPDADEGDQPDEHFALHGSDLVLVSASAGLQRLSRLCTDRVAV
jgi:hypothetical protein